MAKKKKIIEEPTLIDDTLKSAPIIETPKPPTPPVEEKSIGYVDGETQLSKYLKVKDFILSATAQARKIDNRLPASLLQNAKNIASLYDKIYEQFNGNVQVSSGYRSPALNNAVRGSSTSQHKSAQAIDVQGKNGIKNADILRWVQKNLRYNQLIWEYGNSVEPRWVHIGYGNRMQFLRIGVKSEKGLFMHLSDDVDI